MKNKLIKILTEIRPEFDFNKETDFTENGILDSFDIINLVTALDREFSISIDGMDIMPENFSNIDSIISLLKKNGLSDES